ncbi:MAG: ferredoxin [Patescibacteria group bacterium]|nr:ferredoxin [Patescibacteria group bacterium]
MSEKVKSPQTAKVKIAHDKCSVCGTCVAMYDDIFEFAQDGSVQVKKNPVLKGKDLDEVKAVCPQGAIEIS